MCRLEVQLGGHYDKEVQLGYDVSGGSTVRRSL